MPRFRVKLNHSGMAQILDGPSMHADMLARAERCAEAARETAPVDTGAYRDSIEALTETTDRAVGRVQAGTDHAVVVEFKTRNLGRSLDAAR